MKRSAIQTIVLIMGLYDEYLKINSGFSSGIGEYVSKKTGMKAAHIYAMRYYGTMLQKCDVYEQAISENWGLIKIRNFVKEVNKKVGTT